MSRNALLALALAALVPAGAMAQLPPGQPAPVPGPGEPAGRPSQQVAVATMNLANCGIARNAGDGRWLGAVLTKRANLAPAAEQGARMNAMMMSFYGCPVEGADIGAAYGLLGAMLQIHPGSINFPRHTDALADCIARAAPADALAFVQAADAKTAAKDPAAASGYQPLLAKAGKACEAERTALGDKLQENELYSRLNWALRAAPALASASSPASKTAGQ